MHFVGMFGEGRSEKKEEWVGEEVRVEAAVGVEVG
jgi:hypothetical protein